MPRLTHLDRLDKFSELLGEAKSRSDSDRALVSLLNDGVFDWLTRTDVVVALGDTAGPAGSAALRGEFAAAMEQYATTKPHNRAAYCDLMCACVWALGKRDGPGGTDLFVKAAAHANRSVRHYGFMILAAVGDDRAWNDLLADLRGRLAKKTTSTWRGGEALEIIEYLARHCGLNADRGALLAGLLRERWRHVPDAEAVARWYLGIGPGGPPPAEIDFGTHVRLPPWVPPPATHASRQAYWERQSSSDAFEFTYGG